MLARPVRSTLVAALVGVATVLAAPAPAPVAAQAPVRYVDEVFAETTVTTDIAYGAAIDEHGDLQRLHLDLYEPAGDTAADRAVLILAHGGGFWEGNKSSMASYARSFARRGYVVASIQYRMDEAAGFIGYPPDVAEEGRIVDAVHDMQAAVRWARTHAVQHRLDATRVAVGGSSAGGVMAVLTATRPDDPGSSGNAGPSSAVCTAVSIMGAGDPAQVGPGDAGAIFFHGDTDTVVPYAVAVATSRAMGSAGLPTRVVTFPGQGHSIGGSAVVAGASTWMREHVIDRPGGCLPTPDPAHPPFVEAAYADLLGRAPTAGERAAEVAALDGGVTRAAVLTRLTRSEEWVGSVVRGLYRDTLGRSPDAGGLAHWVGEIRSGRRSVAQVAASFHAAPEAYARRGATPGSWVDGLYAAILGRSADAEGRAYWVAATETRGRTWVATQLYGSTESRRDRVRALYAHLLGRAPEPAGLAHWSGRIGREGDLALARSLAASAEYLARAAARFP